MKALSEDSAAGFGNSSKHPSCQAAAIAVAEVIVVAAEDAAVAASAETCAVAAEVVVASVAWANNLTQKRLLELEDSGWKSASGEVI